MMERVVILLPAKLLAQVKRDMENCGCGSLSAHIRHILKQS